ncbi:MAG TPA: ACT domain-containing protein [Clostridia bacterium]|nr:ACT domain-containing protein [Clostridia bacterium]
MKAVLTVVGKDRVGIIAQIANLIAENNSNIVNVEQTIMNDKFTMMMEIEFDTEEDFYNLEKKFREKSSALKLNIKMYNEDLFNNMYSL